MKNVNPLLQKQLEKYKFLNEINTDFEKFLNEINNIYNDFDEDKKLLERSIEISSKEYIENTEKTKRLQAQIIHNEKMAGIGQLSAGIAHEINNPLGFIQSNIDLLNKYMIKMQQLHSISSILFSSNNQEDIINSINNIKEFIMKNKMNYIFNEIPEILEDTKNGIDRIEKIVKSLLRFSRRNQDIELIEYDLNRGIIDTITIANNEIKYIANVFTNFEELPNIKVYSEELNQVILNLLVNSAYSIKEKHENIENNFIRIDTYKDSKNVFCKIEDSGCGIRDEVKERIFEPFFTTKPIGIGTGLGLSIVYDIIVNKHHGNIDLISKEGVGTTITFSIPI